MLGKVIGCWIELLIIVFFFQLKQTKASYNPFSHVPQQVLTKHYDQAAMHENA